MRSWSPRHLGSAAAVITSIAVAGCTIEVNINTHSDEEPSPPIVTAAPDAPAAGEATAPRSGPSSSPRTAPAPPAHASPPAPPSAPIPDDGVVRDALFRFRRAAPPPPPPPVDLDLREPPTFTPFTKAPGIRNHAEVVAALEEAYPSALREAGIGGMVHVYLLIGEDGRVRDTRLDRSSGRPELDEAALHVAEAYRFTPALNRDEPVPVWVSLPITFQAR